MINRLENQILMLILVLFTSAHLYFVFDLYLDGYDRFIEIWYAIYKFLRFLFI
ncbi:MAG: hypothetical protein GWO07_06615 [Candidatus Dadabacteria bacterium]|nr:hypothetical protein [Candidatus Dadabacteria bacterium]NIS08424.1 hypothetical protein [Candidatus Dadabacteria bacterium]NIV41989.1 hypothetical protein [Candidatus Dadabacteria bacterium]NIX15295.1 hypothetical protein [Candidatus Dadabacteria bacterium]NIY21912.1 hypothetical protein [Candidatus Dadabacteria bacterium]